MKISIVTLALFLLLSEAPAASAQVSPDTLPRVVQHADPVYPPLARQTRIQGNVRVKLATDGESVTNAEAVEGHPLLRPAAEENVRSWKFAPHTPSTFVVTFRYKLNSSATEIEFLEAPGVVRVQGEPAKLSILYADVSLGTWKIEWKSRLGASQRTLELFCNGADEEGLEGKFLDKRHAVKTNDDDADQKSDNDSEKIEYGHREGDFVAFSIKLRHSGGRQTPTLFVGHIKENKITGTFVNDSGITGTWTATRLPDDSESRPH